MRFCLAPCGGFGQKAMFVAIEKCCLVAVLLGARYSAAALHVEYKAKAPPASDSNKAKKRKR